MQIRRVALVIAFGITAFATAPTPAADQTVLGKSYVVKDPKPGTDPAMRTIVVLGKELASDDTIVGDPLANGATVEVIANGASPTSQTFSIPAGAPVVPYGPGWKANGNPVTGYTYKDSMGAVGPVKAALIKLSRGTFIVKVTIKGALGPGPQPHITVLPPATGTDGGMRFSIGGGDTYCVKFGGAAGGAVTNAPTRPPIGIKAFKIVSKPTALTVEAGCPAPPGPTTTTTTTTTSTTTTTCPGSPAGAFLKGALPATAGRFNYMATLGLPGANAACNSAFMGTHACTNAELQNAAAACDLINLEDTTSTPVTGFWAIDPLAPPLTQCVDDVLSNLNWEYATAHTASRGQKVALNNGTGALGPLQTGLQCNAMANKSSVGCCQ